MPRLEEGEPSIKPAAETAAAFLVRKVREFPGEVAILAMGPFTNLAFAERLDDQFATLAQELVFMGGAFNPGASAIDEFSLQYIYSPRTEFNSHWDPEAAHMMLHAGWKKITGIPLDATVPPSSPPNSHSAGAGDTPVAKYFAKYAGIGFPMWDETAAAVLLKPAIASETTTLAMDIVVDHGATYGATLIWPAGGGPGLASQM